VEKCDSQYYPSTVAQFTDRMAKKVRDEDAVTMQLQGNKPVSDGLRAIRAADASFSTSDFLQGAKVAFEWGSAIFLKGDKDKLKMCI